MHERLDRHYATNVSPTSRGPNPCLLDFDVHPAGINPALPSGRKHTRICTVTASQKSNISLRTPPVPAMQLDTNHRTLYCSLAEVAALLATSLLQVMPTRHRLDSLPDAACSQYAVGWHTAWHSLPDSDIDLCASPGGRHPVVLPAAQRHHQPPPVCSGVYCRLLELIPSHAGVTTAALLHTSCSFSGMAVSPDDMKLQLSQLHSHT